MEGRGRRPDWQHYTIGDEELLKTLLEGPRRAVSLQRSFWKIGARLLLSGLAVGSEKQLNHWILRTPSVVANSVKLQVNEGWELRPKSLVIKQLQKFEFDEIQGARFSMRSRDDNQVLRGRWQPVPKTVAWILHAERKRGGDVMTLLFEVP